MTIFAPFASLLSWRPSTSYHFPFLHQQRNMASHHAPTSRAREKPAGDEEASSTLVLGEFDGVPSLSLSEARLLINAVMEHRRKTSRKVEETETLVKTQDYLDVFARFKQKENIEAVERLLASRGEFEPFERSQLGASWVKWGYGGRKVLTMRVL